MRFKMTSIAGAALLMATLMIAFNNCGKSLDMDAINASQNSETPPQPDPIAFSAAAYQIVSNQAALLTVTGGIPPYTFTVTPSSGGSVDAYNQFEGNQVGVTLVRVTDSDGEFREISIDVVAPPALPPQSCAAPFGAPMANNTSRVAWNVLVGTCVMETRVCTNGVLSGTFKYASCRAPRPCAFTGGVSVAHGASVRAWITPSGLCASQLRVCNDGTLSGSYVYAACEVRRPR